jgi:hypothetical protein
MTPDSPVGRFIGLNFSQDNIKLVSRVFGTQVLRRSFQPFGCSRRLCTTSDRQSMILYKQCLWKGGRTVAPALREAEWISEGVSTPFSDTSRVVFAGVEGLELYPELPPFILTCSTRGGSDALEAVETGDKGLSSRG